jgi:hypothetical protein
MSITSLLGLGGLAASAYLPYSEAGSQIDYLKNQVPGYVSQAEDITNRAVQEAQFSPFTVRTGTGGTASVGAGGGLTTTLGAEEQALQSGLLGGAQSALGGLGGVDTSGIQQQALGGVSGALSQQVDPSIAAQQATMANLFNQQAGTVGGYSSALSGLTSQALSGAQQALGAQTPTASSLFQQMQMAQSPEQERQRLALENRLAAQGRLGVQTAAYGGTPEQLAMEKAIQEQQSSNFLNATTLADQLASSQQARAAQLGSLGTSGLGAMQGMTANDINQLQALQQGNIGATSAQQQLQQGNVNLGSSLFGLGSAASMLPTQYDAAQLANLGTMLGQAYMPQQQQLAALGAASPFSQLATSAALSRAEQLSSGGQYGLEALAAGNQSIAGLESARVNALANTLSGLFTATGASEKSPFETLVEQLTGG